MRKYPRLNLAEKLMAVAAIFVGLTSLSTYAGGVSDGGGGTTNPHPSSPEWIVSTSRQQVGKMLLLWLNAEEGNFGRLSPSEQAQSPLRKIFRSEKSIFDTVRNTSIELRMSEPCHDKNGVAWDGSIYASRPNAICISAFSMAPKLNEFNYQAETAALILHELSHLHGTTEDEARAIQQDALYGLTHVDFTDLAVALDLLAEGTLRGRIPVISYDIQTLLNQPNRQKENDAGRVVSDMAAVRDSFQLRFLRMQAVRESTMDAFLPQFLRAQMVATGICAADLQEDAQVRKDCTHTIELAFGGTAASTASEIAQRFGDIPHGPEFDGVSIRKPVSKADVAIELKALQAFLAKVLDELVSERTFQMDVYRKD